jgi:hypothetical protein
LAFDARPATSAPGSVWDTAPKLSTSNVIDVSDVSEHWCLRELGDAPQPHLAACLIACQPHRPAHPGGDLGVGLAP